MDGVIANFNKRYRELFHMEPREAEKKKEFNRFFEKFINDGEFATLDWMPGGVALINFLNKLPVRKEILSSTAREEYYDKISSQKLKWLANRDIHYKPNFVPGKRHKKDFATPSAIIIDDTPIVIEQWNEAGGIGILHKDVLVTIAALRLYF